jgi:hypothetical protein
VELSALKPLAGIGAVGAMILAWFFAFDSGMANDEWAGHDFKLNQTRGRQVGALARKVETTAEKEARLKPLIENTGVNAGITDFKKKVLGNDDRTRGNDVRNDHGELPPELGDYTPRDVCQEMRLEFPDRFGTLDCSAERFDNGDNWLKAERSKHDKE